MTPDNDSGWINDYEKDFDYFHVNRDNLCRKLKNEFIAVKSLKVYRDARPLRLQELLKEVVLLTLHIVFIEFMK